MKVIIFCALIGYAAAGSVSWPGAITLSAPIVKTVVPGQTKVSSYSTSQYINTVPAAYTFGAHPQLAYQVPYVNSFAPQPTGYYSVPQPAYIPASNLFYPAQPTFGFSLSSIPATSILPGIYPGIPSSPSLPTPTNPGYPVESSSEYPSQQGGDADSAVIDSAEFALQPQRQEDQAPQKPSEPQPSQPASPQYPNFPNIPSIPQIPQAPPQLPPSYPSIPPQLGQTPSIPSLPQFPQNPQVPVFPQLPQYPENSGFQNFSPQGPTQSPAISYPGSTNEDRGLNDEDTISVESA